MTEHIHSQSTEEYLLCINLTRFISGAVPYDLVGSMLSEGVRVNDACVQRLGPYCNFSFDTYEGPIVMVTAVGKLLCECKGQAEHPMPFTVYLVGDTVTGEVIEKMKASGESIVDFMGTVETYRDEEGRPTARRMRNHGRESVSTGEVVFVREPNPGEPPGRDFVVRSLSYHRPPRSLRGTSVLDIDPTVLPFRDPRVMSSI